MASTLESANNLKISKEIIDRIQNLVARNQLEEALNELQRIESHAIWAIEQKTRLARAENHASDGTRSLNDTDTEYQKIAKAILRHLEKTPVNEDMPSNSPSDRENLKRQIENHQRELDTLQLDAATYLRGNIPQYLSDQIRTIEQAITYLQNELGNKLL